MRYLFARTPPPGEDEDPSPVEPPSQAPPEWQGDLDSLFSVVDSQMVERRATSLPGAPSEMVGGRRATDPGDPAELWIGFGIEERPQRARETAPQAGPSNDAVAAQVVAAMRTELHQLVATTAQDVFASAFQEQLRHVVKDAVDSAIAEAAEREQLRRPAVSRRTVVSIRFYRTMFFRRRKRRSDTSFSPLSLITR